MSPDDVEEMKARLDRVERGQGRVVEKQEALENRLEHLGGQVGVVLSVMVDQFKQVKQAQAAPPPPQSWKVTWKRTFLASTAFLTALAAIVVPIVLAKAL